MLSPLPYYKWFWQDFRANRTVQRMTYIERGLYRELLDECWSEGSIPADVESLADICGCPTNVMANAWQVLGKCFALVDGRYVNEKMESVRTEKDSERVRKGAAGRKGGISKSLKEQANVALASNSQAVASNTHIEEKRREEKRREERPSVADATTTPSVAAKPKKAKATETTLQDWLTALDGKRAIAADDPLLTELADAGVPDDFQRLAWLVFKRDWLTRRAKDWPATFRNAVRRGWIRLWYFDATTGECRLNQTGELARRTLMAE